MSRIATVTKYSEPFVMVVLVINGLLFCLGALSDHSSTVIVIYLLLAALNFVGSCIVGAHWKRKRKQANAKWPQEASDSGG